MPQNLILIVLDTARADAFEPYGAPAGSSPAIADLARRGTPIPRVLAPSNWTLPSHASMLTGLLPGTLGLTTGVKLGTGAGTNARPLMESSRDRVLAEVLRARGYDTAAISANPWIHEVNGFATGFERFVSIRGGTRGRRGHDLRSKISRAIEAWRARMDDGAAQAGRILREWLDAPSGRPFFWFVNLMECHSPYLPPRPYNDLGSADRLRTARDVARYQTPEAIYRACTGALALEDFAVARMRRLYAGAIRQMDDWIGALLEELDRRELLDDTLVVITSDHGENLGENGLMGHTLSMDQRLISVPLVFSRPVAIPDRLVSLAELPRFVAGELELEDHPWIDEVLPRGCAISQVAGQLLLPEREKLARGWGVPEEAIRRMASPITAAIDGALKLVRDDRGERLYDLTTDAQESSPIDPSVHADSALVARLRAAIDDIESLTPAEPARELVAASDEQKEVAALEERLRDLGYI